MRAATALRRPIRFLITGVTAGLLLLVSSCRTAPSLEELEGRNLLGWLPPESDIVIRMLVPGNEQLAELLLAGFTENGRELEEVTGRALLVAAGVELSGERPVVHLATVGTWPRGVMGSALGSDWEKVSRHRWSGPGGLELTLPERDELILSEGKADVMLQRAAEGAAFPLVEPSGLMEEDVDLRVWITDMEAFAEGDSLLGMLTNLGISITDTGLMLRRNDDGTYRMIMNLRPDTAQQAPGLAFLARGAMALRFRLSPVEEEKALLDDMAIFAEAGQLVIEHPAVSVTILQTLLRETGAIIGGEA